MKMQDVISILQRSLHKHTDLFTTTHTITGAQVGQTHVTYETDATDLQVGDLVTIKNVMNGIEVASMEPSGSQTLITTTIDHGLCDDDASGPPLVFWLHNLTHSAKLIKTVSNTEFICEFASALSLDGFTLYLTTQQGFNGFFNITDITPTGFEVEKRQTQFTQPILYLGGGVLNTKIRIAGAADMERFNAAYTKQQNFDCWLVVVPADNRASRSRDVTTDAISGFSQESGYSGPVELRQTHIETIRLYAVIPASMEIAGRSAADLAEEIRWMLYKAIINNPIPTIAQNGYVTATVPVSDSYFSYLSDNTTYTHEYVFERSVIVEIDDTFEDDGDTAPFRELDLTLSPCDHDDVD